MTPDEARRDPDTAISGAPTGRTPTAWAVGGVDEHARLDAEQSATFRALAWSQDDGSGEDLVPYSGGEHTEPETPEPAAASRPWYRQSPLLFGAAAAVAAVGIAGLAFSLAGTGSGPTTPAPQSTRSAPAVTPSNPPTPTLAPPTAAPPAPPPRGAPVAPRATAQAPATTAPTAAQQSATYVAPQPAPATQAPIPQAPAPQAPVPQEGPFPVPPVPPAAPAPPAPIPQGGPFPVAPAAPAPAPAAPNPQGGPFPVPPAAGPVVVPPVVPDVITIAPPAPVFRP